MKVLVIYDSECRDKVECLRNEIVKKYGTDTVLRIRETKSNKNLKKKKLHLHTWHKDAARLIHLADMIVYYLSEHSAQNNNVEWELKTSIKENKYIVCFDDNEEQYDLNKCLRKFDANIKKEKNIAKTVHTNDEIFKIIDEYNNDEYIRLFNDGTVVDSDSKLLLEQYKMFTTSAESLVTRRLSMNSFYISANTALISIGATVFALSDNKNTLTKIIIILALSIPGIMLNISWRGILKAYFINNRGKMKILSMIEKKLAVSLYDAEWKAMKNKYSKEKYISFTDNEKKLPLIFIILYGAADIAAIAMLIKYIFWA